MPSWKQHFGTTLKQEDIPRPVRVTIESVDLGDIKNEDGSVSRKLIARFVGKEKTLPLNQTNCEALQAASGTTNYEEWGGATMELYVDPTVKFGTKTVGGLRLRPLALAQPRQDPRPTPPHPAEEFDSSKIPQQTSRAAAATQAAVTEDDIPF